MVTEVEFVDDTFVNVDFPEFVHGLIAFVFLSKISKFLIQSIVFFLNKTLRAVPKGNFKDVAKLFHDCGVEHNSELNFERKA